MPVTTVYLDTLNSEQRRAVEHGLSQQDCATAGPLLVIAGAGSGKTNTFAHRVAHGTSAEIEEERRLLYVAMTRAKDDLHLIVPQKFFTHGQSGQGDRHVYASRTRFILEGLLGLFDRTSVGHLLRTELRHGSCV